MSEVQITMPIIDAFMLVPQYSKFLKDDVTKKKKEMEGMVVLTHECSAIIQRLNILRSLKIQEALLYLVPLSNFLLRSVYAIWEQV